MSHLIWSFRLPALHHLTTLAIALLILPLAGCISVPQASVDASQLVGQRIAALQVSHEAFVTNYFELSRQRVEDFLINRWIPEFLDNFIDEELLESIATPAVFDEAETERFKAEVIQVVSLSEGDVEAIVEALNRTFGDAERGNTIITIADAATTEIAAQREELLSPINQLEREALQSLRASYAELNQLQSTLTAYIQSIRGVSVEQDALLGQLQLLEARDRIINEVTSVNNQIQNLLNGVGRAEDILEQVKELLR